jgi:CRP/FNR family transcriptional regulator, cyclic AMP receptor protein
LSNSSSGWETCEAIGSSSSASGKEAVLALLGPRRFFGESALGDATVRHSTATTLANTTLIRVNRSSMTRALQSQRQLQEAFMAGLLSRTMEVEGDLCSQLLNQSAKRLARVLLKLAVAPEDEVLPGRNVPHLSHEILAEMVGTTRSRVTLFLNQFRKQGMIDYDSVNFVVRPKLLAEVLTK